MDKQTSKPQNQAAQLSSLSSLIELLLQPDEDELQSESKQPSSESEGQPPQNGQSHQPSELKPPQVVIQPTATEQPEPKTEPSNGKLSDSPLQLESPSSKYEGQPPQDSGSNQPSQLKPPQPSPPTQSEIKQPSPDSNGKTDLDPSDTDQPAPSIAIGSSSSSASNSLPKASHPSNTSVQPSTNSQPHQSTQKIESGQNGNGSQAKNIYTYQQLEAKIEAQKEQIDELYTTVNNLFPLMAAVLQDKTEDYQEAITKNLIPIIDQVITQRSQEDNQSMASAIADILPGAIAHEIKSSPTAIAKAIAPEVALAIKEQIHLDRQAISTALGPEMGQAIKTQINVERDAMVDALYPVIGNTISKYMAEAVKSINQQVENALSVQSIKRKIRAKIQGVSEAELIVAEAIGCEVEAVFLIQKTSGLVIAQAQQPKIETLDADMLGGMLTAIRSFANEYMAKMQNSELCEIDYGDAKILLEVAGYAYLAVVVKGEPPKKLVKQIRQTLSRAVLKYETAIKDFDGNPETVPASLPSELEELVAVHQRETPKAIKPNTGVIILLVLFALVGLPFGLWFYRHTLVNGAISQTAQTLYRTPELSVYGLDAQVKQRNLILTGRLPNQYLRQQAEDVVAPIAEQYNLDLDNQVVAVKVPESPVPIIREVTETLNQKPNIKINTDYRNGTLTVAGKVLRITEAEEILAAYRVIPGVENLISNLVFVEAAIMPIYFDSNSVKMSADTEKISQVKQFLEDNPDLNLCLIGYADAQGTPTLNQNIARQRAMNVQTALIERGIPSERLKVTYSNDLPPGVTSQQPLRASRAVYFEPFFP